MLCSNSFVYRPRLVDRVSVGVLGPKSAFSISSMDDVTFDRAPKVTETRWYNDVRTFSRGFNTYLPPNGYITLLCLMKWLISVQISND